MEVTKQKIFPLILRISPEEGVYHAILLTKIKHGIVHYLDPAEGPLTMALHKFVKVWDGTGLLIEEDNGGPFGYIIEEPNQNKNYLISSVIQIVSGIFCVLGIYFVNRNINIVFPVSFLSAFIITEMVLKIFLFKTMKEKDNFYTKDLKIDKSKFGLFFEQLEKYKTLSSVNPVNFFTHLIICFFIIFVSILNSVNNLVLILLPLCLVLIDFFIYVPWRKKKDLDIQLNEAQLRQSEDIESYKTKLSKIHGKAYSLGGVEVSKRYIYIFIMILSSILVATISKDFSITSIVFCLFLQILLYDNLQRVIAFSQKRKELDVSRAKLLSTIHQNDEISST